MFNESDIKRIKEAKKIHDDNVASSENCRQEQEKKARDYNVVLVDALEEIYRVLPEMAKTITENGLSWDGEYAVKRTLFKRIRAKKIGFFVGRPKEFKEERRYGYFNAFQLCFGEDGTMYVLAPKGDMNEQVLYPAESPKAYVGNYIFWTNNTYKSSGFECDAGFVRLVKLCFETGSRDSGESFQWYVVSGPYDKDTIKKNIKDYLISIMTQDLR